MFRSQLRQLIIPLFLVDIGTAALETLGFNLPRDHARQGDQMVM